LPFNIFENEGGFCSLKKKVAFVAATGITIIFFLPFSNLPLLDFVGFESSVALELST